MVRRASFAGERFPEEAGQPARVADEDREIVGE
jgi:hypothetical protein